jgi:hypothetical protein
MQLGYLLRNDYASERDGWIIVDLTGDFRIRVTENWLEILSKGRDHPVDPNNPFSTPGLVMGDFADFAYIRFGDERVDWEGCNGTLYHGYRLAQAEEDQLPLLF